MEKSNPVAVALREATRELEARREHAADGQAGAAWLERVYEDLFVCPQRPSLTPEEHERVLRQAIDHMAHPPEPVL